MLAYERSHSMSEAVKSSVYRFRYFLAATLTICYSMQYLDRVKTNVLMPFISQDIGMSNVQIGIGAALMLVFYGPAQLVTGWVCDRIGSRRVMIFSIISWSLLTYWQGEVRSVGEWYFRMVLFGIMIGTEFIPSTRLIVRYFPPLQRARGQSVLSWSWIITPAWAPLLATFMYTALGNNWRDVFHVLAFAGVLPLALTLLFVHDKPEKNRFVTREEALESYSTEIEQGIIRKEDVLRGETGIISKQTKALDVPFSRPERLWSLLGGVAGTAVWMVLLRQQIPLFLKVSGLSWALIAVTIVAVFSAQRRLSALRLDTLPVPGNAAERPSTVLQIQEPTPL
jgi:sugar phosphate permease